MTAPPTMSLVDKRARLVEATGMQSTQRARKTVLEGIDFHAFEQFYEILALNESLPYLWRQIRLPGYDRNKYRALSYAERRFIPDVDAWEYAWFDQHITDTDLPKHLIRRYMIPAVAYLSPAIFYRLPRLGPNGDPWREGRVGYTSLYLSVESANLALMVAWLAAGRPEYLRE